MNKKLVTAALAVTVAALSVFGARELYSMGYNAGLYEGHTGWYDKGYSEGSEDGYERGFAAGISSVNAELSTVESFLSTDEHAENSSEHANSSLEHGESGDEHANNESEHGESQSASTDEQELEQREELNEHGCDFVLNENSKRFHKPNCKSISNMKEENKKYYSGSRDDLIANGYKPCGSCKP